MPLTISDDGQLFRRALVASLALHVLLALFLPTWIRTQSQGLQPIESLSFARLIRLQLQRPVTHAPPHALPQAAKRSRTVTFAHVRSEISARTHRPSSQPRAVVGPEGAQAAAPKRAAARAPSPLYARASTAPEPVAASRQSAVATPEPAAAPGERSITGANGDRGGVLPLGAEQDPVLDPGTIATIQQKLGSGHVTLRVTVGEDGRTLHVVFDPPLDAQTEREIEAILADATWDAAVCGGGVSCQGVATIKL